MLNAALSCSAIRRMIVLQQDWPLLGCAESLNPTVPLRLACDVPKRAIGCRAGRIARQRCAQ